MNILADMHFRCLQDLRKLLNISLDPGLKDYHWYRLDNNGLWSHKPGSTPATTVDGKGNEITDPRNAANSGIPYKFVAFMYSKPTSPIS
jgi:hypothetical protein